MLVIYLPKHRNVKQNFLKSLKDHILIIYILCLRKLCKHTFDYVASALKRPGKLHHELLVRTKLFTFFFLSSQASIFASIYRKFEPDDFTGLSRSKF